MTELARIRDHFALGLSDADLIDHFEARFRRQLKNFDGQRLAMPDETDRLSNALQDRYRSA